MKNSGKLVATIAMAGVVLMVMMFVTLFSTDEDADCDTYAAAPNATGPATNQDALAPGTTVKPMKTGDYTPTSPFGMRGGAMHQGVDFGSATGKPIYASADGTVGAAGDASGFGQWIVLDHNIGGKMWSTVYGHMFPQDVLVKTGDKVTAGQHIANAGYNGEVSPPGPGGTHLHFETWDGGRLTGGKAVDPQPWVDSAREVGSAPPANAASGVNAGTAPQRNAPTDPAAVSVADWDKIAEHEAGGNWSINTGNGYFGGLQFSASTWTGAGGGQYAPTADKATKEQQMEVANRVLATQGWNAWPQTSVAAGVRDKKPAAAGTFVNATGTNGGPTQPTPLTAADNGGGELPPLPASKGSEARLQIDTIRLARAVAVKFPQIKTIGGWREDPFPDHPSGRAIDVMIPNYTSGEGKALGDAVANYVMTNKKVFNVEYIIWQQTYRPAEGPSNVMTSRGGDTANHMDHVHITTIGHGYPAPGQTYGLAPGGGSTDSSINTGSSNCSGGSYMKVGDTGSGVDNLAAGKVPAEYEPWYRKAGKTCPQIGSALLAAQGKQESGFNPKAISPDGAGGISQFMPGTAPNYVKDDDGNGQASVFDPGDAIMGQARYMCQIAATVDGWVDSGEVSDNTPGGRKALYLAAYNAGEGAVQRNRGFPTDGADYINQTRPYADKILAMEAQFASSGL